MQRVRRLTWAGVAAAAAGCAAAGPERSPDVAREAYLGGDEEHAAREARLAIQRDPLDSGAHFVLGCVLARQGEADQALVGFRRAYTVDPAHPQAAYNAGTLLLRRSEPIEAARWLETAVSTRPGHAPSWNNLGKAYALAGLPEFAAASWEEALRLDPGNAAARANLAALVVRSADGGSAGSDPRGAGGPGAASAAAGGSAGAAQEGAMPSAEEARLLRDLLRELPYVTVEQRSERVVVTGWARGPEERALLDRVLASRPDVLDLTTADIGDSQRLIEVDATLFVVIANESVSLGFNFLRLLDFSFDYFATDHQRDGTGFTAPGTIGLVGGAYQSGWLVSASVDYDVNIANAADNRVAVLARPHLTTLSGTPATFLAGGDYVFRVSGLNSGDIKPYPFGTTLTVTPTLLRTPGEDGEPRVHLTVEAGRSSVLGIELTDDPEGAVVFDKIQVTSHAVLGLGRTLILSGLSQKDSRTSRSGVPILSSIPLLKYLFSEETLVETQSAVVILLTPRDPAFVDARNREALNEFVALRREFMRARQGPEEDLRRFREKHPGWTDMPPNRFATHLFLTRTSELYRSVTSQGLTEEDLDLSLLGDGEEP